MNLKKEVHNTCLEKLQSKLERLGEELKALSESTGGETKSSMGDKYETSREMIQQEKNKIGNQMELANKELAVLKQIDLEKRHESVKLGSLVKTEYSYFYLSVPLGQIEVNGQSIFILSENAPLAKLMIGKEPNQNFQFNKKSQKILEVQ